jgi:hypothetical protein
MRAAAIAALALIAFCGCADKNQAEIYDLGGIPEKAPVWIKNPDYNGRFAAVGGAVQSVGGTKFQQIEASAHASEVLRGRIEKIALIAAKACFDALKRDALDDATLSADARLASLMIAARASNQFERVDNWWSPSRDYYALFRVSEETLKAAMIDMLAQFAGSSENYSAKFGMLRDLKMIDDAASAALAAAE